MVRVKKPDLVYADEVHNRVFSREHGISSLPTLGQRQLDLAADKQLNRKPPVIGGNLADFTAQQELLDFLEIEGHITNGALRGTPETDPLAYEDFQVVRNPVAVTPSTSTTGSYSDVYSTGINIILGTWTILSLAEASFTNSAGGTNAYRLEDDFHGELDLHGAITTTTDRERYACRGVESYPPGSYTFTFQYKPNANTATARAPWILFLMRRTK